MDASWRSERVDIDREFELCRLATTIKL